MTTAIGIAGYIGSGKTLLGHHLVTMYGFTMVNFSDPLKAEVKRILPRTLRAYALEQIEKRMPTQEPWGVSEPGILAEVDRLVYRDRTPVMRGLLQEWGTDLRRHEDPDYWTKIWSRDAAAAGRVVACDTRFPNEAQAVRSLGGYLIRVTRPGHAGDSHVSEHALADWDDYDLVLHNIGSVDLLTAAFDHWARHSAHLEVLPCSPTPSSTT